MNGADAAIAHLEREAGAVTSHGPGYATVVISRRVTDNEHRRFRRWLRRLRRAIERSSGYIGMSVQPPDENHPCEWVVIYQFRSERDLDAWLCSAQRAALIAECDAYLVDRPIEQRIVQPRTDSVTLISAVRLRQGAEKAHRELHENAVSAAGSLGGLIRHQLIPAVAGAQPDTVALLTFHTRDDLDRWMRSAQRRDILRAMSALTESERTVNVVGGYAGWFSPPGAAPKQWKQAIAVIAGLIPVSLLVTAVRQSTVPDLPLWAVVPLTAVANVAILTWLVMPLITRALRGWLT
ncbi:MULTISPECIES: antibiotic biosynthesis monooxygenase [unclassified Mycobacterium]|uniref:antibiotic biosynthesis monooxygenase n=1 Tax=unclassified Mycobacterium TaxID=2642494 RepID=UPI0006DCD8F2|nr:MULTISPECIES: antibiotic biosynthesis monooxygenase [unclassified Mycobacterium]